MTKRWWRYRKNKCYPLMTYRVGAVIYLFLNCHAHGLEIMLGMAPFPDSEELAAILAHLRGDVSAFEELGTFIQSHSAVEYGQAVIESAEKIQSVVEMAGGIERFNHVFRECQRENSEDWRILVDWHKWVKIGRPAGGGRGDTWRLVERYHQHPDTLRRRRDRFVLKIADDICLSKMSERLNFEEPEYSHRGFNSTG